MEKVKIFFGIILIIIICIILIGVAASFLILGTILGASFFIIFIIYICVIAIKEFLFSSKYKYSK